jgi:glycine/D-amino acid oxidase-like deaminating enzyme
VGRPGDCAGPAPFCAVVIPGFLRCSLAAARLAHVQEAGLKVASSSVGRLAKELTIALRGDFRDICGPVFPFAANAARDGSTVAADSSELLNVEREFAVAQRAGLLLEMITEVDLPYDVAGAVRLADQVAIDPARYARGLAAAIEGDGSRIFEDTRALSVREG